MMFVTRVKSQLTSRIDAEFYSPSAIEAEGAVKAFREVRRFGDLVLDGYRVVYHGIDPVNPASQDQALKFLSPSDVDDQGELDLDHCLTVPEIYSNRYPKGIGRPGELLIEVKGNVSKVAVLPLTVPKHLMISGSFYKATLSDADVQFVLAFFKSSHGTTLKKRLASNSIIDYVAKGDLYSIPIPYPARAVQHYIGEKVRQAQLLRDFSERTIRQVDALHDKYIPRQDELPLARRAQRISPTRLDERLDAEHFPPAVYSYLESLAGSVSSLGNLTAAIMTGQTRPEVPAAEGAAQLTVANLSPRFVRGELRTVLPTNGSDRRLCAHDLLLCNVAHTKSYIGKDITYFDGVGDITASTEVTVVRVKRDRLPASFIRRFLLTHVGYLQLQATVRGITAHSYPKDVAEIGVPVPSVPSNDLAEWFESDELLLKAARANRIAGLLTKVATFLVEGLIEGRLKEDDFSEAQKALENGDRSADRAILMRITKTGVDVTGVPRLFRDLDYLDSELLELGASPGKP